MKSLRFCPSRRLRVRFDASQTALADALSLRSAFATAAMHFPNAERFCPKFVLNSAQLVRPSARACDGVDGCCAVPGLSPPLYGAPCW